MKQRKIFKERFLRASWLNNAVVLISVTLFASCNSNSGGVSELDGLKVPEGFSIERVAAPDMLTYPMFASFDNQGRLFVFESDGSSPSTEDMLAKPSYHVRLLEDTDGDGIFDKNTMFADSLTFPKGGVFYDGSLYVTASPEYLKFTDTDGDGVADKREVVLNGWVLNHNAAILGGPFFGPDGWMYLTDARRGFEIATKEGDTLKGRTARIWRCRPDGTGLESMSGGGYDNAIEIAFTPAGETLGTMTYFIEPQAGMRDAIMHWVEGGVYPKHMPAVDEDKLKLTGDLMPVLSKTARVAPSGLLRYRGSAFGDGFDGNLFSAEFNTGRIMRHQLTPDGATYKSVDEPFITSASSDIHLTDVLQDADGSMLVINTGGWFIAGCPLSRVAKLDVRGALYRIKKNGAKKVDDPWGRKIDLKSLAAEDLVKHASDARYAVSENAMERLIQIGEPSVATIKNSILTSKNEELRAAGVFALYRINTPNSLKEVLPALNDESVIVKTAAARVLGMAKNKESVNKLMELVQKDKAPVRRQAATALGQIGNTDAVSALLNAATDSSDRFVEHAITYALITLKNPALLTEALNNPSSNVRRTAIIALDQMDGQPLRKEHLVPFLNSTDPKLQSTGIWVASHHLEWADVVINFVEKRLQSDSVSPAPGAPVYDLMIKFSNNKQLQDFIGQQLASAATPASRKAFMIDIISHSTVRTLPENWIKPLGGLLQNGETEIRSLVLGLIEARNIKELGGQLKMIIDDPNKPAEFKLKALNSRLRFEPALSASEFGMISQYLDKKNVSPLRQLAASVLASAKLNDNQLLQLSKEQIATTDVFLLPNLVGTFEGNSNPEVGQALIAALKSSPNRLDNLSEQDLKKLFSKYPTETKISAEPLLVSLRERNAARLAALQQVEAKLQKGDVGQGRKLFMGKATCVVCHSVGSEGGNFGPDLTNIGEIRSTHDILEAIIYPSASFAREHETSRIITKTTTYRGIIKEQLSDVIIIATGPGQLVRVQRSEISSIEPDNVSTMPPGLDKALTPEELSDLMAFLSSLPNGLGDINNHPTSLQK